MWVRDGAGVWERLRNRLKINKLVFKGNTAPATPTATKDAIKDLSVLCKEEGADVSTVSSKPLSLAALVAELEKLGLIRPSDPIDPPRKSVVEKPELEGALANVFSREVRFIF